MIVQRPGTTTTPKVDADSALAKSERELAAAIAATFESFCQTGVILDRIRIDREFRDEGFDSFEAYMDKVEPCGIKKSQAYRLIAAKNVRQLIEAEVPDDSPSGGIQWTERSIRPLTKLETKRGRKTVAGRVVKAVQDGEKFTAKLVQTVVDKYTGADRERAEKRIKEVKEADTPAKVIGGIEYDVRVWTSSLQPAPGEFWEDVEAEDPNRLKRAVEALAELLKVLNAKRGRRA